MSRRFVLLLFVALSTFTAILPLSSLAQVHLRPGQSHVMTEPDGDEVTIMFIGSSGTAQIVKEAKGPSIIITGAKTDSKLHISARKGKEYGRAFVPRIEIQGEAFGTVYVEGDIGEFVGTTLATGEAITTISCISSVRGSLGPLTLEQMEGSIYVAALREKWEIGSVGPSAKIWIGRRERQLKGWLSGVPRSLTILGNLEGLIEFNCPINGLLHVKGDVAVNALIEHGGLPKSDAFRCDGRMLGAIRDYSRREGPITIGQGSGRTCITCTYNAS
ncbi:MAG: hypothetical protein AB1696_14890 [Planctomycetota bacterium]